MRSAVRRRPGEAAGFGLIEVLVAIMLVSAVVVPAMSSVASFLRSTRQSSLEAQALDLARSTIEALKDLGPNAFSQGASVIEVASPDGKTSFDVERVLSVYDEDSGSSLWQVTVSVYEHPKSEVDSPVCALTTLIYPQ
jgi:Tfp pilus assembly protein PilV